MTTSVLDRMTSGLNREAAAVMQRKGRAAAPLTPVAGESAQTVAEVAGLAVPKDVPGVLMAREAMADVAKDLRVQAQLLIDVAAGIDVMLGVTTVVQENDAKQAAIAAKLAEKEADRRAEDRAGAAAGNKAAAKRVGEQEAFDQQLAAKAAAAQAATFAADATVGWTCPQHGDNALVTLTATKSGRKYLACTVGDCEEFEPKP